jgi:alkanesulfonate monooxygenase SsuD/methylene tetrahydromethanopterin reductase-like flavin-dependent oxidoreductase (luciferase family)
MRFGVHLPLMGFGAAPYAVQDLVTYVETATALGFEAVGANDHVVFGSPWLDGPTALAAVVSCSGGARLVTTAANPVVRGPAVLAKALATLDVLSGGRVVAGLAPGSSDRDYASVGVPFDERWPRFDEAVRALRAVLRGEPFRGHFYSVDGPQTPLPARPGGLPLWVGSWGSNAGMRRVARLGDGWLASAYNIGPDEFGRAWVGLRDRLETAGRDPETFENAVGTMWFHVDPRRSEEVLSERLAPVMHRPVEQLRERLAFGPGEAVREKVTAFRDAGAQWMFVWPVGEGVGGDLEQLHRFHDEVMTRLDG